MLERPNYAVQHQLELCGRYAEEGGETVIVNRLQKQEEIGTVVRILFEIFVDHRQRALENRVENFRNLQNVNGQCNRFQNNNRVNSYF